GEDDVAIIVATAPHRSALAAALRASGVDVEAAVAAGRYLSFDAQEMLATFMVDGAPDGQAFRDTVGGLIDFAAAGGRRVRIYGEMVAILWEAGDVSSAIALEDLWNDLASTYDFALLCAYPMRAFEDQASAAAFKRMCDQHTGVIPSEGYSLRDGADEQQRAVARLQREMAALRSTVTRLHNEREVLAEFAFVDAVTGLPNRKAFDRHLEREWALAERDGIDSFVIVVGLDGFGEFTDQHGHAAGEEALREFAGALGVATRRTDIVARLEGGEFAVLLVRCREAAAHSFKARMRGAMADRSPTWLGELEVSLGHASLHGSTSAAKALERADLAMFARQRAARLEPR
ncbi:MAG: diguanylate cyclase domain-containing protein, partial [Acidimicrobiales bacterium]